MSPCERLSDRMPAVAAGREAWSVDDRRHLEGCADCAAEWQLVRAARALGASRSLGSDTMADTVLARVREAERMGRRRIVQVGGLVGLAAAAALAVSVLVRQPGVPVPAAGTPGPVPLELRLAELDGASDEELGVVLAEFDPPISGEQSVGVGLDALEDSDVQRALSAWEES